MIIPCHICGKPQLVPDDLEEALTDFVQREMEDYILTENLDSYKCICYECTVNGKYSHWVKHCEEAVPHVALAEDAAVCH